MAHADIYCGELCRAHFFGHAAAPGCARQVVVVQQQGDVVGTELDIKFGHAKAVPMAGGKRGEGVFRCQRAAAAVGNP